MSAFERVRRLTVRLGVGVSPSTGLREGMQWLLFARLGILFAILTIIILGQVFRRETLTGGPLVLGYGLLALSFAFNLGGSLLLGRDTVPWWLAVTHVLFDAAMISIWIAFSGSKDSLFALLYLIQILFVAIILYQRGAWLAAIVACLLFGVVMLVKPLPNAFVTWSAYSALFLTLGFVGGYLSEELLRTTESLQEKSRNMEKLQALQARILSDLPSGLLTVDSHMRIGFVNPAAEHILGHKASQYVGKSLGECIPGLLPFFSQIESRVIPDAEEEDGAREGTLSATGSEKHRTIFLQKTKTQRLQQVVEIGSGRNVKILRGDVAMLDEAAGLGGLLNLEATGGKVLLFQDVTKLVHLEDKLKQSEKLAAVGQLAAGIAHEIRNPLAGMSASIEMLKSSLPASLDNAENHRLMDIAIREIDRLNGLITEFLDFVKPEKLKLDTVDLPVLLGEVVLQIKESGDFRERIRISEKYGASTAALAHRQKLKQVILNLLVNAAQAMTKGGEIEVGCARVNDQRVKFWVTDQGHGMDEEVLSHLYEPFFTTKDKGTGLGLATAHKIVEAHHGEIRVTSEVNSGTRFEIWLPAA